MTDREKVIKGVEHCDFGNYGNCYEKECPYYQSHDCTDELKNDVLALLREQEVPDATVDPCKSCQEWECDGCEFARR